MSEQRPEHWPHDLYYSRGYSVAINAIGLTVALKTGEPDVTGNSGGEYVGENFTIRAYCWCDGPGDREGHDDECPPNFEMPSRDIRVSWYKHSGRGPTANRDVSDEEWVDVLRECLAELSLTPDA